MPDIPADLTTEAILASRVKTTGTFETLSDSDWYKVTLTAGKLYSAFALQQTMAGGNLVLDLRDPSGRLLLEQDAAYDSFRSELLGGDYWGSTFGFTVRTSGTYFIAVRTANGGEMDYEVTFTQTKEYYGPVNRFGSTGNDVQNGTALSDVLFGLEGNDTIKGGAGTDSLFGGQGDDRMYGGEGRNYLEGEDGNDRLWGGSTRDRMWGGAGDDTIRGGAGNDQITGDAGRDQLFGGAGNDTFIFSRIDLQDVQGRDVIGDFKRGADRIDLDFFEGLAFSGRTAAARSVWYEQAKGGVSVQIDDTGDGQSDFTIFLTGVTRLAASDFIL